MSTDPRLARVKGLIVDYPDFPKPGILFRDIFPVFYDPEVFTELMDVLKEHVQKHCPDATAIVGLESRGFLFAPILSKELKLKFVPIRKKGKLPGETVKVTYQLEYGEDTFEMKKGALQKDDKVVIVDDLLATGGTMSAACQLVSSVDAKIDACLCVIELVDLHGRDKVQDKSPIHTLIQY